MGRRIKIFVLSVILFSFALRSSAQHKDTASSGFLVALSYAEQLPGGSLAQLWGYNSNMQGGAYYKTEFNWIYGASFSYIFGNQLRDLSIIDNIATSNGNLIANDGNYSGISYFERGFDIQLTIGKLLPVSKNLNSGILFTLSAGYIQHHIDIESLSDWTPQISGDYLQGYDRLTAGVCTTELIGYQYISKKSFVAVFGGFEFTQGFVKSLRYDFVTESKNPKIQYDFLSGIRVGWILPILESHTPKFYTY